MCVVPNITDYHQKRWPDPWRAPYPVDILELIRKAKEYDKLTKQEDCVAPDKDAYIKELEKRVKKLEDRTASDAYARSL